MKLIKDLQKNQIMLEIESTGKEVLEFFFPTANVHYWYPFNLNFSYRYSDSKKILYLVEEKGYAGENIYNAETLKRSKRLPERSGVMFHAGVYHRNMYIMVKAAQLGLPSMDEHYDSADIQRGFDIVAEAVADIKLEIEDRYMEKCDEAMLFQYIPNEDWDQAIYEYIAPEERKELTELGEMYNMLVLMKKLHERG